MEDDCGSILLRADGPFRRLYAGGAQFGSSALFHPIRISLMTTRGGRGGCFAGRPSLANGDRVCQAHCTSRRLCSFVSDPRVCSWSSCNCKPVADSCLEAARRWIGGDLDAETAQGYATAEEFDAEEGVDPPGEELPDRQDLSVCNRCAQDSTHGWGSTRSSPSQILDFPSWKRRPPTGWSF